MNNAILYARYSSHGQTEQSIEGQLNAIYDYAAKNGYNVIREYIDRALSGTSDKRPQFQKMLNDSAKQQFDVVLVYSLDRFARNRYDSAIHKAHLKKNNIRVISVTETITDDPAGIMIEGLLESMAEYYSAELSQKVKRGIAISVNKCQHIGSFIPLGYTVDEHLKYQIDPLTAPIVERCFALYAAGNSLKRIGEIINEEYSGILSGNIYNTINRMLDRVNYRGVYNRGGSYVEGGMPRIVSDELFNTVQRMRNKDKKTPARARAHEEYILTTKIYCSMDNEMMVGVSGTSKTGAIHHYYTCKNVWNKNGCTKKNVKKDYIENFIVSKAFEELEDNNIALIAKTVSEISKCENNTPIVSELKKRLKDNTSAIDNLLHAIESGEHMDLLSERITQKKNEKADLEKQLARELMEKTIVDEAEIKFFLNKLKSGNINDTVIRRALISIFINKIYLSDDHAKIVFNVSNKAVEVDYSMIEELEKPPEYGISESSYMTATAPD